MLWLKKLLAIVLVSSGAALLILPNWSFVFSDSLITARTELAPFPWSVQMPWLRNVAMATGVVFILLGMFKLMVTYRASQDRPGIPIASVWFALFCDVILLAAGIFCIALALDSLWLSKLGQKSFLGLDPEWPMYQTITALHFVANLGLFVALPLLTLIFTSLSSQRIAVDSQGVTSYGAIGSSFISWPELENVSVREQKNPAAFTVFDFRSIQRVVDLEGAENGVTINEPTSRNRKQDLQKALRLHAPDSKRDLIKVMDTW